MAKFVIYEVWTRVSPKVIEAVDMSEALFKHDCQPVKGMSLCNWHAIPVPDSTPTGQGK